MKTKTNLLIGAAALLVLAGSGLDARAVESDDASKIKVTRMGSQPSREGPAEYFTGSVRVDPLFETGEKTNKSAAYVTFQPGARSAWHTHPNGQILIVSARHGPSAALGRSRRGNPIGRRGVDSARTKALAWRIANQRHDAHRHPRRSGRQERGLDGKSQRRAISYETNVKNRSTTERRSDGLRANQATQCPGPEILTR